MALIDRKGHVIADDATSPAIATVDDLTGNPDAAPQGVLVRTEQDLESILPYLDRLALVVVEFPKFRDGRGFTIARALRERYRFAGDVRALGHVIPDQFAFLVQCGFSSLVTPADHPPAQWAAAQAGHRAGPGQLLHRMLGRGIHGTQKEPQS